MIFSHFKRRRGIRFDDGFRHSAREPALDPLVATYDEILATDPTVPVLLQLTEYRGQQVLWQDPECTVPVEEIGDPIGGVRHPETGEILAVQETDSARPAWGGIGVGADPEVEDYLILVEPHGQYRSDPWTIVENFRRTSNGTRRISGWSDSNAIRGGHTHLTVVSGTTNSARAGGNSRSYDMSTGEEALVARNSDGSVYRVYKNGEFQGETAVGDEEPESNRAAIMNYFGDDETPGSGFAGEMKFWIGYEREVDAEELDSAYQEAYP